MFVDASLCSGFKYIAFKGDANNLILFEMTVLIYGAIELVAVRIDTIERR